MVAFEELRPVAIFICGAITTIVIGFLIERLLTWHDSKLITIQKRSDEFINLSEGYYLPLGSVALSIRAETDSDYKVRPKILFFKLAKCLSLFARFSDAGVGFSFPKRTQECKVATCAEIFLTAVNLLIFNDDKESIERVINYYNKRPDLLSFIEDIETLLDYSTLKFICNNGEIIKKLYNYSGELGNSIFDGITEEYKIWYKFEFIKTHKKQKIEKNAQDEKIYIKKLHKDIYNKI